MQCDKSQADSLAYLSERLLILIKLKLLMLCGGRRFYFETTENDNGYTLKGVFSRNKGVLSELLSKHIVMNELPPKLLTFIDMEESSEDKASTDAKSVEAAAAAHSASTSELSSDGVTILKDELHKEFYGYFYHN
jgi:hypothetical protein